jgi:hypothetical protein
LEKLAALVSLQQLPGLLHGSELRLLLLLLLLLE